VTEEQLTVGQLAKVTKLSRKSIRYYEQEKLIPKANRSVAGYRLYPPTVIDRLKFIQKAKSIGFHLDEIRQILQLPKRGKPCCDRVYAWSEKRLAALDEQIRFLQELRERLVSYQKKWKRTKETVSVSEAEICALIESVSLDGK